MHMTRRSAIHRTAALGLGAAVSTLVSAQAQPAVGNGDRRLRVAVVALGRGMAHVNTILSLPDVDIAYLAEVDPQRLAIGMKTVAAKQDAACKGVVDFRTCLDDTSLDAVFIATPNFWHTPAAVLAMKAGKHVYVEKPGSQNPHEAELIVAAARRHNRLVQMGNQRRTWMREAIEALHAGPIGEVRFARGFYYNGRPTVPRAPTATDAAFNLDLWQGPVADEPDRDIRRFIHYDWHWLWHWGNGELGNNGVHVLDVMRWGLKTRYPTRISYTGGRYWHRDKQETPDTGTAVYDFGTTGMEWVQSSCMPRSAEKPLGECVFYGDGGTFAINGSAWTVYDPKGVQMGEGKGPGGGDAAHIGNFLEAIRGNAGLNSPIDEAQVSTMLCHLGNIAYRTGTVVQCNPETGRLLDNPAGEKLWKRPYRPGWEPTL